jgi:hypothetical protein
MWSCAVRVVHPEIKSSLWGLSPEGNAPRMEVIATQTHRTIPIQVVNQPRGRCL